MVLGFLYQKNFLARLKGKTIFVLMCIVMKTKSFFEFKFQIKNLKTQWICCLSPLKTSHVTYTSKI